MEVIVAYCSGNTKAQRLAPSLRPIQMALALLWVASFSVVLYVAWTSRLLRPIADDYPIAVSMKDGLFQGVWGYFQTWSGALTTTFFACLFAGLPLLHLPLPIASALPFLSTTILIVAVAIWFFVRALPGQNLRKSFGISLLFFPVLALTWWGFWWLPALTTGDFASARQLALAVTHWQTINTQYAIPATLLIWGWSFLETRKEVSKLGIRTCYLLLGVLSGFNGPTFAISSILMISVIAVASQLRAQQKKTTRRLPWALALLGNAAAMLVSNFSPGSQRRKTALANPEINSELFIKLLTEALPDGVIDWLYAIINPGAIVLLIVVTGFTAMISVHRLAPDTSFLVTIGLGLIGFSLVSSVVSRIMQFFSYDAFWHVAGPRTIAWLALTAIAMGLGARVTKKSWRNIVIPFAILGSAIGLLLSVSAIDLMCRGITTRSVQWEIGPAPLGGISDIEDPDAWVMLAWLELRTLRDAPARGLKQTSGLP